MVTPQFAPTASLLPDGRVLIASGPNFNGEFPTLQLYDALTEIFSSLRGATSALYWHTATVFQNGQVLLAGGGDSMSGISFAGAAVYDPIDGTLNSIGNMTSARFLHASTLLPNGTVLITGGAVCCTGGGGGADLITTEFYDPFTRSFFVGERMTTGRSAHSSTLLADGRVLIAGGFDSLHTAELFSVLPE
jgi:hypothetical protein